VREHPILARSATGGGGVNCKEPHCMDGGRFEGRKPKRGGAGDRISCFLSNKNPEKGRVHLEKWSTELRSLFQMHVFP